MDLNLFLLFLSVIWFPLGFIGYGISIGQEYAKEHNCPRDIKENGACCKLWWMLFCITFGFISFLISLDNGYKGLRFW